MDSPPVASASRVQRRLLDAVVVFGIALRCVEYFASVSVWLDEAMLALNVRERSLGHLLFQPLAWMQIAPKGYLLVQGIIFRLAGDSEYAMRLFPLVCSIAGVLLFRRLALRVLEPSAAILATLFFATTAPLIRYAGEAKPYGIDATAAIIIALVALRVRSEGLTTRRLVVIAFASACVAWFSAFATLVLAGVGAALVCSAWLERDRSATRDAVLVSGIWGVVALAVTMTSLLSMPPEMRAFMHRYWVNNMLPSPATFGSAMRWLVNSVELFFIYAIRSPWPRTLSVTSALGLVVLWRRRPDVALILAWPIVVAIGAGAARQYPLFQRLIIGLLPAVFLTLSASAAWVADRVASMSRARARDVVFALFAIPVLQSLAHRFPPFRVEEIKPVLAYIRDHQRTGDGVFAHYTAAPQLQYYAPFYGFERFELGHWPVDTGSVRDLEALAGRPRVWIVFVGSAGHPARRTAMLGFLDRAGTRLDSVAVRLPLQADPNAEGFLYDLSRPRNSFHHAQ